MIKTAKNAGADELTPSIPQYFSWINNTNEGSTEEHTLINLDFFNGISFYINLTLGKKFSCSNYKNQVKIGKHHFDCSSALFEAGITLI